MPHAELTEELVRGGWLGERSSILFRKRLGDLRTRMSAGREPVLVAEADPVDFLAVFFAALLSDRPVVAGNFGWGREEWKQALDVTGSRRVRATGEEGPPSSRPMDRELKLGDILIPTGGTSGRLRFARHSWRTLTASAEGFAHFFDVRPVNSVCVLPLFHVSGLMQVVRAMVTGGEIALVDWREVEMGKIPEGPGDFFLSLVPSQLRRLIAVEELHPWMRSARAILLGGAAAPAPLLEHAANLRLPISLCYGATETAAMATAQKPGEFLGGDRSSGRPLPHVGVRIVGPNDEDLGVGEDGIICIASASLFGGYIPGAVREGKEWKTGDLGFCDKEGRLTVTGREDDLVVTGGEKVFPGEVERVLLASGLVEDVFVFGIKDPEWGQAVAAVYVPVKEATPEQLRAVLREELASFKVPKIWLPVANIPRTAQGKIDRERVDAMLFEGRP